MVQFPVTVHNLFCQAFLLVLYIIKAGATLDQRSTTQGSPVNDIEIEQILPVCVYLRDVLQ